MAAEKAKQLPAPKWVEAPKQLTLVEKMENELTEITNANFYEVPARGGDKRMEPDAKALQFYANKKGGIATKIVDSGMDMTHAWAHVQAWLKNDPSMIKEDKVTIIFEMEFQSYVWDYVSKGCRRHQNGCPIKKNAEGKAMIQDGIPVLDDPVDIMELRKLVNRKMRFSEREAITKAEGRLHKKLLSMEFRDPEEIESEAKDVALLSDSAPLPTTSAAAPAQEPKKEPPKAEAPKQAAKPPEKAPETKAEPPKQTVPATKTPAAKPTETGVPKAHIPSDKEVNEQARQAAVKGPEAPPVGAPKKRSEILAELALKIGCSSANILAYMAKSLNCTDPSGLGTKPKVEIDAVITAIGATFVRFGGSPTAMFIKGEKPVGNELDQTAEISEYILSIFAQEMNKAKEVK